ncbi:PDZ and LIM domain protein 5a isoform X1 [Paramormyrops kingsleyae]|uniref:PDZ and LIM domain protein 5a isoform X1 n=1 Tax=Paramormyrops kingsleyae TaxID=1676925 RepID=UPI003B978D5F
MSSNYSVCLMGPAPWGFRLQGGKDFNMPLTISRLTDGGKAAKANVAVGDVVLSIDGISTDGMNHLEAQNKIKACAGNLNLTLQKASSLPAAIAPAKDEPLELVKPVPITRPAPPSCMPTNSAPGAAHNKTARPFGGGGSTNGAILAPAAYVASIPSASSAFTPASATQGPPPQPPFQTGSASSSSSSSSPLHVSPGSPARVTVPCSAPVPPQPSVYNTPINLYSNENACEVAMGQRRGLLESQGGAMQHNGVPRKHVTDTDIQFYHVPSHSDASKKRLMEDTEDWRPRTGTSQSRSFRILAQITGTEHEQPQQKEVGKKTNEVEEAPSCTQVTSAVTTMTKTPAAGPQTTKQAGGSSGPAYPKAGMQVGHVTPKGPGPARPVPQPHPKDEDSLVQRAEHIPAGTRTPMCAHCDTVIRGPFLVAMGKSWHPEEFNCAHCGTSLAYLGFVEELASVYCEHCYEEFLAPTCARCQHKILGEVINALKQAWHVHCFLCASCQQPIRNNTFHLEDGEPYCEADYYSLFGTSCRGCEFPIEAGDRFLEAMGFMWHDTCFVCAVCSTCLQGQAFYSKKDKPLCKKHAHSINM